MTLSVILLVYFGILSSTSRMPTDGADFGHRKTCYGKAFSQARAGADPTEVARLLVRGVERDIQKSGGIPVFNPLIDALVLMTQQGMAAGPAAMQERLAVLGEQFADSSLTRYLVAVAEQVGLEALQNNRPLSSERAAERILAGLAESRGCEGLANYVARGPANSITVANEQVRTVRRETNRSADMSDLVKRMLAGSERGLPAKAARVKRISHDAADLNNAVIGAI